MHAKGRQACVAAGWQLLRRGAGGMQPASRGCDAWQPLLVQLARQYCSGDASVRQLSPTSSLLRNLTNGAEVYLIGTAHVSSKSAQEVREMVRLVQPQAVVLELCEARLQKLRGSSQAPPGFLQTVLSQLGMPGTAQSKLLGAALSGLYSMLRAVGMEPGAEFKAGIEEAERIGAAIVCGDREQHVTAQRISQNFRLQDLMRLMAPGGGLQAEDLFPGGAGSQSPSLEETVERLKTREAAAQMSQHLRSINPDIARALVDERDEILAQALLRQRGKIVGVVGLAHLEGIERVWREAMRRPAAAIPS